MKTKHHFWSSLVTGGALYWATGSPSALAGAMAGGFLIDADHIFDQMWSISHGAPYLEAAKGESLNSGPESARGLMARYVRRRKLVRLPLIFHSYELLILTSILAVFIHSPFLVGVAVGYILHLSLDLIRHHHEFRSPLFYLVSYRLAHGFRRDKLIKPEYL